MQKAQAPLKMLHRVRSLHAVPVQVSNGLNHEENLGLDGALFVGAANVFGGRWDNVRHTATPFTA